MQEATAHDYSEYAEDVEQDAEGVKRLHELVQQQIDAEHRVEDLESQLKEAKSSLNIIQTRHLPEVMDELNLPEFTTKGGIKVTLRENIRGSIPKANEAQAFDWLDENGYEKLIKQNFLVEFGREDEAWANKFQRDCNRRKRPLNLKRTKKVHPQTLCAWAKEVLEEGVDLPMELFGIFRQRTSKIRMPR